MSEHIKLIIALFVSAVAGIATLLCLRRPRENWTLYAQLLEQKQQRVTGWEE